MFITFSCNCSSNLNYIHQIPRNALSGLNISNRPRKVPNFDIGHVMVYLECIKNNLKANEGRNGRIAFKPAMFPHETTFPGDGPVSKHCT